MVAFYNETFDCQLVEVPDSPMFAGSLCGFELVMCPNDIAQVVADQNRHQLRFAVEEPEELADQAVRSGGTIVNRSGYDSSVIIGVADPEGNTFELVAVI